MNIERLNELRDKFKNKTDFIREAQKEGSTDTREILGNFWDMKYGNKTSTATSNLGLDNNNEKKFDILEFSRKLLTSSTESRMPSIDDVTALNEGFDLLIDKNNKIVTLQQFGANVMEKAFDQILIYTNQQTSLLNTINEGTSLTSQYSKDFRSALTDANPRLEQLGISFDELASSAKTLVNDSGKFAITNQQTWERAGEVSKAYLGTLADLVGMYPIFAQIGLGAADAAERIADAGAKSTALGLESRKVANELKTTLGKINEYGFKNGVEGLTRMVQKSIEFRMSMNEAFKIAEKVMNPEGALELSANLQVLGGAIGDFNDPLKLMYMATNNVEGLQDALIGAASTLATYNSEQGRFEITGLNLRRAKEMAAQLGVEFSELTKGAIAAAERTKVSTDLMARGLQINDEQKEFITNIAQMKGGRMVVELGTSPELIKVFGKSEVAIDELTQNQLSTLLSYQEQFKKASPEEIIRNQATSVQNISRDVRFMTAMIRKTGGKTADELFKMVSEQFGYKEGDLAKATLEMSKGVGKYIEGSETKITEAFKNLGKRNEAGGQKTTTEAKPTQQSNTTTPNVTPNQPTAGIQKPEPQKNIESAPLMAFNDVLNIYNTKQDSTIKINSDIATNTSESNKLLDAINKNLQNFGVAQNNIKTITTDLSSQINKDTLVKNVTGIEQNTIAKNRASEFINKSPNMDMFQSQFEKLLTSLEKGESTKKDVNVNLSFKAQDGFVDPIMRNFRESPEIAKLFVEKRDYLYVL
jgi:hypothetical protein